MTREIKITVTTPLECTEDELLEWVRYNVRNDGGMSFTNPLCSYDLEADEVEILPITQNQNY